MSKFKDNIPGFPGYHVTKNGDVYSYEYRQRPRRAIFSHKGGRKKAQYYTKRKTEYYCNNCGRKKR